MRESGISGRIAQAFIDNKLTPIIVMASLLLGLMAVVSTPREEEPQIVVPMIDVTIGWPGASPDEVERLVVVPVERALRDIAEIEYVYATSQPSGALIIARFYVGSDPDRALINVRDRVARARDQFPPGAMEPDIVGRTIDDVPVLAVTFTSDRHDPLTLRRMVAEVAERVRQLPDVSTTTLIGGLNREMRVELDPARLAAAHLAPAVVLAAIQNAGVALPAGSLAAAGSGEVRVEAGDPLRSADDLRRIVLAAPAGKPVLLGDVATVHDGAEEPELYVFSAEPGHPVEPAVTLAVAKIKGANATKVAEAVLARIDEDASDLLPEGVHRIVTRNYGETAADKSNELILHLLIATLSVVVLMALFLGLRDSLVVGVAVPVTLAMTLFVYYLLGYTLNRVTLFALIFSIGILVDDAIVVVENIHRHLRARKMPPLQAAIYAVDEVGNPTILATFTVIAAILPMAFVSGLMGPYMRPIPIGASFAMLISLLVAFAVSPWVSYRLLSSKEREHHGDAHEGEDWMSRAYRAVMRPLIARRSLQLAVLGAVVVLLIGAIALVPLKFVTVKMLPFDNKSEVQVVIDAPEGTTLEGTLAAAREMTDALTGLPEVSDVQIYAGTSAPFNFNGLVRHYYMRSGPNVADLQVNLLSKDERDRSSHAIAGDLRPIVREIAERHGLRVKVAEIPPGPPVLSTLVAEVYGPDATARRAIAEQVLQVFDSTDGVVDTDWYVEADQPERRFVVDRQKAALSGVDPRQVAVTLRLAVDGVSPGVARPGGERSSVPIVVTVPRAERDRPSRLGELKLISATGASVPLSEVVNVRDTTLEPFRYRKNGRSVTYVIGDVAGSEESPVYAILSMSDPIARIDSGGQPVAERMIDDPSQGDHPAVVWDGEWRITYEVFRDLGVAFGVVLVLIYVLVVAWFRSFLTPLLIMAPIPLTLVGILPGHAVTGMFFTATSMIGMIALAGIIVRNSILLVDFIELSLERGMPLREAVLEAGAVRFRPIFLTAAAVIVGAATMILDPIFQGLAVALMTGIFASTVLTLFIIPLLYYLFSPGHRQERAS